MSEILGTERPLNPADSRIAVATSDKDLAASGLTEWAQRARALQGQPEGRLVVKGEEQNTRNGE